jgi:hypothetical protein
MFIVVGPCFVPKRVNGITLWPFIIVKKVAQKQNKILLNHERIHLRQQLELLIIPFYLWYGFEFLIRYAKLKNWDKAYRAISFEREAYANEANFNYLENRSLWSFLGYFSQKL